MNTIIAVFIKQFRDNLKNAGVLVQFIIFPGMAFLMTYVVDMPDMTTEMQGQQFINMFAGMFIGMSLLSTIAIAIAEDREKNSLRFLMMAGVKSHEYLLGLGGVTLALGLPVNTAFVVMMPGISLEEGLIMLASMMVGTVASVLAGATIGMNSNSEQEASGYGMAVGMFLGFGPMIATMSGNETLEDFFGVFYTMNFVTEDFRMWSVIQSIGISLVNVLILAAVFAWVYGKQSKKGGIVLSKKAIAGMVAAVLLVAVGIGGLIWHNAGFVVADDARVAAVLVPITPNTPGVLERFMVYEGRQISRGEIIGWVENGEAMRSPIDGRVIQTNVVQGQFVNGAEPIAIISDTSTFHILGFIEESDILSIQLGRPATVTIETFGSQQFSGVIASIGSIAEDGLVPIEITMSDDVNLENIIGATAAVRIPIRGEF